MATTTSRAASATESTGPLPFFHTIGIGAGPANLSLAALHESATDERIALFDKQPGPSWHDTLLHTGVRMQTSWLKDLVSIIDPTHKLSFLNYLVSSGRLFALLHAQFDFIPRREYMNYLTWASAQIENIHYGVTIDRVSLADDGFVVYSQRPPAGTLGALGRRRRNATLLPARVRGPARRPRLPRRRPEACASPSSRRTRAPQSPSSAVGRPAWSAWSTS